MSPELAGGFLCTVPPEKSAHFLMGISFLYRTICALYILDMNPLLINLFADIFSHSVGCHLVLLFMFSFAVKSFYIRSHLFIFVFIFITLGSGSKKILL